jgi:hypothetical protein
MSLAITTKDNPYDPINDFDSWFRFDEDKGYHTCSYLARIANTTSDMSNEEIERATEAAIDEIIKYDFLGIYRKIKSNEGTEGES